MTEATLNFLGPARLARAGAPVALARAKGVALLLYLALTRGAQPRERVLDLLWPASLAQAARKNMRNALWEIGEALGHDALEQSGAELALAPGVNVDIYALEDGLLLLEGGAVAPLEAAVARYRGPLADGLSVHEAPEFEIWLTTERERMAAIYLRLLDRIIALHRGAGGWPAVIDYAQRALAADPLREPAHMALIEAEIRLGQRARAAQHYAALTDLLRRELDVAPLPETSARYAALLAGAPAPLALPAAHAPALPAPPAPFVGRRGALAALDAELAAAARGAARVALIAGDLGIGKSQLWRAWAAARSPGTLVLATHAIETGEPVPFGPLLALFRQPGPARSALEPPAALAPIWLSELARLLPELALAWPDLPPPLALTPAEERARLLQALTEAIRALAQPALVLVIDDLHWADPSTIDWLIYLLDHLRAAPLLVVGAYRPQDAGERLLAAAAGWQRRGQLREIALPHLAPDESRALLAALGPADNPAQAARWIQQSGGNPYFLIELRRAGAADPPGDLAALVRARIQATVPASALQVLQAAAVLGDGADFATLRATSGRGEEETLDALDALTAAAVLTAPAGEYQFVHPLVATVVRRDLAPARRAFLHRRAAQAIERLGAGPASRVAGQLAEHYAAAGEAGLAAHYAEQAARQAQAISAFVEAAGYARRALDWEPTPARHLLLGEALLRSSGASVAQAQLQIALRGFQAAANAVGATRALIALSVSEIGRSRPDAARAWLTQAPIAAAQLADPALGAQAHLLAATVARQSQDYAAAPEQLDQAAALARAHGLVAIQAQVAFERGNLLADIGDRPAALAVFAETLRLAQDSADPIFEAMARNNLAYQTLLAGDSAGAQAHCQAAIGLGERYALSFLWQYVHSTAGEIALAQGELGAADAALEQAFEAARSWDNQIHMANIRANQSQVAAARRDWPRARALLSEARALFGAAADPFVRDKIARAAAALA